MRTAKVIKTSFTITKEAHQLLRQLATKHGQSMVTMLELLIRERAKKERLKIED